MEVRIRISWDENKKIVRATISSINIIVADIREVNDKIPTKVPKITSDLMLWRVTKYICRLQINL